MIWLLWRPSSHEPDDPQGKGTNFPARFHADGAFCRKERALSARIIDQRAQSGLLRVARDGYVAGGLSRASLWYQRH